ncbi:MAG TPA: hypothetical protein PKD85_01920 [Saprospiraceae bacterium]|nr:hypothetical protein [Saprospiraceae bacterium]
MDKWKDLIDPEFEDFYEQGGFGYEDDVYGGEVDDIGDPDRKATYKESQLVSHGGIGKGLGATDGPKGKGRGMRTPEDVASEQIRGVLAGGNYEDLNQMKKADIHKTLMNYPKVTVANIPVLVAAGLWIQNNPKEFYPKNKKLFDSFIKKYGEDLNPIDIVRYIRSINSSN